MIMFETLGNENHRIEYDKVKLQEQYEVIETLANDNKLKSNIDKFSMSYGGAIDSINECLSSYEELCTNMNTLYESTSRYIRKAASNIINCEEVTAVLAQND